MEISLLTIREVENALAANGQPWVPGITSVSASILSAGNPSGMFGLRADTSSRLKPAANSLGSIGKPILPTRIDWRIQSGGRLSSIRDQGGKCGACVAFATVSVIESRHWIEHGVHHELSEAELFHCNGGCCVNGWGLANGFYAAQGGVRLLSDGPWVDAQNCLGGPHTVQVKQFEGHFDVYDRKNALQSGPVVGGISVFTDFLFYTSGVYRHVAGDLRGQHAICIVGYDDVIGAWIARNSWGNGWGDGGYFHIAYGECDIDREPFYSCTTRGS